MPIVSANEIAKVLKLDKLGLLGNTIGSVLLKATKLSKINAIYETRKDLNGVQFIDSILKTLEVEFDIPEEDLKRIPKTGAFITVSNHPLGGIDGLILMKLLLAKREDYRIIANFLLHRLEPVKPYIMPVNPFEDHKEAKSSVGGLKEALSHLRDGKPLGMFPAGEVSTYKEDSVIADKPWEPSAMKLVQKANVPIIPIYFKAKNSIYRECRVCCVRRF